jgi:haloacetate dehalogenase
MFEGFETFSFVTQSDPLVDIHGITGGSGPPLLLLHGFPQTHMIWHLVSAKLSNQFTIIALDLRGYGASSKPDGVAQYVKSAMARDCSIVMEKLGYSTYFICAHDRGARVAHKLLVDFPDRVKKAIFLDICPTLAMYSKTDFDFAKAYFHWFFLIQKSPLPENMISNDPRGFAERFMGGRYAPLSMFHPDCFEEYVKRLSNPDTVHAMCEDYRAAASLDMDEARKDIAAGRLIETPLRVLWGKHGVIEKCFDAVKEWTAVSKASVDGIAVDCGHYIPEEAPDVVTQHILRFLT